MSEELNVRNDQPVSAPARANGTYIPDVDICETTDSLWLWADMPGVDDKSVDVQLADGVLSISGQVSPTAHVDGAPLYTEYGIGNFTRRFTVSSDIDAEHVKARMANGVLEVELPKAARAKPRRIAVSAV